MDPDDAVSHLPETGHLLTVGATMAEPAKLVSAISGAEPAIPGLVWAFRLHSDGSAEALPIDRPIEFSHDGRLWLHFNLTDARARPWIAASTLPPLARELLLSNDTFQQLHVIDHCVYGVFSDLVRDIDSATEETAFLRFAMTEHLLVSGRHQALCSADATRRVLEGGYRVDNVAHLLEKIVDEVADTLDRMADKLGQETASRNASSPTMPSRRCAAISAGCAAPASGCIVSSPACACCFTGSTRRTRTISRRACGSTPASWRSGSMVSITTSSSCASAAGCSRRSCASRTRRRATTTSTRSPS
ncbi:hypothetical protein NK6_8077 [Bradyrhizobium diazoefficiens]|uniref:Uncharacterized protein n=1 Tax=Bradyrhizobium diazoefficiens TaxID=1355477 RepID=A0A0E4BUG8_9BRAD|nr:hypothetical protein NK6_8077 [Bradyrhizobium diazoefficiens]